MGKCVDCGTEVSGRNVRCESCKIDRHKEIVKENRAYRHRIGMCMYCKNKAVSGKTRCEACIKKSDLSSHKQYIVRKKMHEDGKCIICGNPSKNGTWRCEKCSVHYGYARRKQIET